MSQCDMHHQVTEDGGASATDGYSPAGEVSPPATRLLDLPPALLDDIACRVMQLGARSQLPLTCCAFSQARLLHIPALRIQLGRQCCDQLLTPRVVAALQARSRKLALTLWQPEREGSMYYIEQLAPTLQLLQTEYTQDYTNLLDHALAKLDNCVAVECCKLTSSVLWPPDKRSHLHCPPGLAQQLLDSFPSLTALALEGLCVSSDALASLLSHPPLAQQLQQLHLTLPIIMVGDEPLSVGPLLQGLQLKQLSICSSLVPIEQPGTPPLPSFQPLAQHLTQLDLMVACDPKIGPSFFREYLQPLVKLQVLTISNLWELKGVGEVVQALPQLHTLQLPDVTISGQQELDTLLAATQITSLQLRKVEALDISYADAPCSWQRLELTGRVGWKTRETKWTTVAYLPLHALSQPLVFGDHRITVHDIPELEVAASPHITEQDDISDKTNPDPDVAAAFHLVAQACKVPVQIKEVKLYMEGVGGVVYKLAVVGNPELLEMQREDLVQLVALLQPLQCCFVGKVEVHELHEVTAADVLALAPLCRDCTHFELWGGSIEPSLEFWRQLVQLMPAVQQVEFNNVEGCVSTAMHESLQLMAEQPWARWLDITLHFRASRPPACWQAGSWVKAGIFKVSMFKDSVIAD